MPNVSCNQPLCKREAVCTPVMVVPIIGYPVPLYLQYKGAICNQHALAFSINSFTDWNGSWYDMVQDHLRSLKKPATNPFPKDPSFNWEAFSINPNWEAVAKGRCFVKFWQLKTLTAKGAHQSISHGLRPGGKLILT